MLLIVLAHQQAVAGAVAQNSPTKLYSTLYLYLCVQSAEGWRQKERGIRQDRSKKDNGKTQVT